MTQLSTELYWLTLTTTMTGLMWVPYILNRIVEQGMWRALTDPQGVTATNVAWADRMARAHANAVENLIIFAPLVLAIEMTGLNNEHTALACMVYFFARLTHFIVFSLAIPMFRVLSFMVSVVALIILMTTLLGAA